MRTMILSLMAVMAVVDTAQARDCSGQGSDSVLTFDQWSISTTGKSQVELSYRLDSDKPTTLVQGHVYFQVGNDVLADTAIDVADADRVAKIGVARVALAKDEMARLAAAEHDSVSILACVYTIEHSDGSGTIID